MGRVQRFQDWVQGRRDRLEDARTTSPTVGFAFDAFSYDADTGAQMDQVELAGIDVAVKYGR